MRTLMRCLHGSRLYGTSTPSSDHDFKSLHVPSAQDILLQAAVPVLSLSTGTSASRNGADDMDDESFALHKFMRMLRDGDTNAVEMIFAPDSMLAHSTPEWEAIRSHRARFVNARCSGYVGYCRNQASKYSVKGDRLGAVRSAQALLRQAIAVHGPKARLGVAADAIAAHVAAHPGLSLVEDVPHPQGRAVPHWEVCNRKAPFTVMLREVEAMTTRTLEGYGARARAAEGADGVDFKAVSHALRVGFQARELLTTGGLTLPRPLAEAAYLLDVKLGRIPFREVGPVLDPLLAEVEAASASSVLPPESDVELMDSIVFDLYGKAERSGASRDRPPRDGRDARERIAADPGAILAIAAEAGDASKAPPAETLAAMATAAGRLRELGADRIRDGLFQVLASRRPSYGLRALNASGGLDVVLPEVAAADGVRQNDYHRFQVLDHVLAVVDAAADAGEPVSMRLAALLHDVAKPATAVARPDGRGNRFHGHETVGAGIADALLRRLGVDEALRTRTTMLVREHMYPTRDADGNANDDASIRKLIGRVGLDLVEPLTRLRRYDVLGKGFDFEAILAFEDAYALRVKAMTKVAARPGIGDLPVDGRDVAAALIAAGAKPAAWRGGPEIGVALKALVPRLSQPGPVDRETMLAAVAKHAAAQARAARAAAAARLRDAGAAR